MEMDVFQHRSQKTPQRSLPKPGAKWYTTRSLPRIGTRAPQQIEKVCSKPKITISKPNPNIVIYCVNQTQTGQFEDQITKGLVDFRTTILGIDKLE